MAIRISFKTTDVNTRNVLLLYSWTGQWEGTRQRSAIFHYNKPSVLFDFFNSVHVFL